MSTNAAACICGSDEDVGFMICCDECNVWMHGPCVSVTKVFATGIDLYFCPRCRPQPQPRQHQDQNNPHTFPLIIPNNNNGRQSPPIKRKRGRPRKVNNDPLDATSSSNSVSSTPTSSSSSLSSSSSSSSRSSSTSLTPIVQTSSMLRLSEEILLWIFAFVRNQRSLSQAGATCKRLWRIAHDPYLWKFVILDHTVSLRKHWAKFVKPRLISAGVQDLTLLGEIPPPVHIDRLQLNDFRSLQALRLDDIRTYSVYTLARTLPWLRIFEARRIKGSSDIWDWRPFRGMRHLEELMLWRDESPLLPFNLSIDAVDDIYPHEAIYEATYGAHLPGVYDDDLDILDDADVEGDDQDELELLSLLPPIPSIVDEETESATSVLNAGSGPNPEQEQQHLTPVLLLPRLKKLALVNIGSMTTHQGTDSVMRKLVGRCHTFIYGNSFNILFPMVKTSYRQLRHLTLLEPSGPAWKNGTGQNHARVFEQMTLLESIQIVNPNMSRKFMVPIVDALLGLRSLRLLHVVLLELDIENVDAIFRHVIATNDWHGTLRLTLKVEPELGDVVINTPKSMRRGWLRRRELDLADMYFDEQDTSDGSTSSSLYGGSRRGSAASTSALVTSSEWCRWACEEAKALGHRVVAMGEGLAGSTGRDLGKKGADDCSVSSDKLSVEIEMITKTQASDLDLSQVCLEAWQAH